MEHLDHILGINAGRQFHGGDYLSAESSSSVSSVETSKPRLAPQSKMEMPPADTTGDERDDNKEDDDSKLQQQSAKIERNEGNSSTADEDGGATDTEIKPQHQHPQHFQSPLWSLEPRIFATEKGNGKRKYLVGEFGRIADWYWRKTAPESRHLYEVIREGSPCRLYFDLEYNKLHNTSIPEVQLLRELEEELATELQLHYGKILLRLQSSQIVNLDSSNKKKFSRHWIVHLFGTNVDEAENRHEFLFQDAPTVGRFVKRMVGRLAENIAADDGGDFAKQRPVLAKHLFVDTKDPTKQTCVIDLGVYTRNRLFRCLGSSKKGKATTLRSVHRETTEKTQIDDREDSEPTEKDKDGDKDINSAGDNDAECDKNTNSGERCYFPLSMPQIRDIEPSSTQSSTVSSMDAFVVANDWEPHAQALADSLVVPLRNPILQEQESSLPSIRILKVDEGSDGSGSIANFVGASGRTTENNISRYPPTTAMTRRGSPLPTLDRYVSETLATRGGARGSIRAWSIEYEKHRDTPVSFTYHLQKNRFCEIVGRSHKSNNVFWTIDLNSWTCIQGCHDPECFGRGSPLPIPNHNSAVVGASNGGGEKTLETIRQEFDMWQEAEFEKALSELNLDALVVAENERISSTTTQKDDGIHSKNETQDLSDDALLQAITDNPELFP